MGRITKAQRETTIQAIMKHTYQEQYTALAEKYKAFMQTIIDETLMIAHTKAKKSGINDIYFETQNCFKIDLTNDIELSIYIPFNSNLKLPASFKAERYTNSSNTGHHCSYTTQDNLITPRHFYGTIKLANLKQTTLIKKRITEGKKLIAASKALAEEIDEYASNITSILTACTTTKKLEETFPAAVKFLPTEQQVTAAKMPVPVELINTLTQKLNQAA